MRKATANAVTPVGWPEAVKAIAALNPPVTVVVIVEVPEQPCATETEVGEAEMLKPEAGAVVTVRLTVAVCVVLPLVPVTVIV